MHYWNIIVHNFHEFVKLFRPTNVVDCTFCRVTTFRSEHDQYIVQNHGRHGRAQMAYNHEDEIRGMYVIMGNEGTHSNGHEEGKVESMNLVETIKILQKDVQSSKYENDRLMKSKEKQ
jgi:hypothetical protein